MSEEIEYRPLSGAAGIELLNVDLRTLTTRQTEALLDLFDKYYLILARGQKLNVDDQVRLLSAFGPVSDPQGTGRRYSLVSNVEPGGNLGSKFLPFHRDFDFVIDPPPVIALFGVELRGAHIPTEFVDCVKACRDLPAALEAKFAGKNVVNKDYSVAFDAGGGVAYTKRRALAPELDYLSLEVPMIRPHQRTGDLFLSASEMESSHIVGLSAEESIDTLTELFDYLYAPERVYSHEWAEGDLLIWDNVAMEHGRRETAGFGEDARRTLRKTVICEKSYRELLAGAEHYRPELRTAAPFAKI